MKEIKKILAKSIIWVIVALVLAFPLALIPMVVLGDMVADYDAFLQAIKGQLRVLYLIFVVLCFVGVLFVRFIAQIIKVVFEK